MQIFDKKIVKTKDYGENNQKSTRMSAWINVLQASCFQLHNQLLEGRIDVPHSAFQSPQSHAPYLTHFAEH